MEIIPYARLEGKHRMLNLFHQAGLTPFDYRSRGRGDFRIRTGNEGFCALENGELLGFVGVMEIPSRTLSGSTTNVGGIWGVATDPNYGRRGVARALTEAAHRSFSERGLSFSFLTSYRSWVAYDLYRKLGYMDIPAVAGYSTAYSLVEPGNTSGEETHNLPPPSEEDVAKRFATFTKNLTGFVTRPSDCLRYASSRQQISRELCVSSGDGYALAGERLGAIFIRELVAFDIQTQARLLSALQYKSRIAILDPAVTTHELLEGYKALNYHTYQGRYSTVMVKALQNDVTFDDVYGSKFYISALEWF
jgi:ribosomal protein S18 acetylase RimI-like enzyme